MTMRKTGNILRMGFFPFALGLVGVFVSGTLNRVMIVELAIPATLVGVFFSVPLLLAPLRMWLGYRSDSHLLLGLRREPYIVLGAIFSGTGVLASTTLAATSGGRSLLAVLGLLVAFMAYGVGKHLSSNTFEALIADKFEGAARSRAITLYKIPMFVGIIGGAIGLGRALETFSLGRLITIAFGVAALGFLLAGVAVLRQEPRDRPLEAVAAQARQTSFGQTFRRLVWQDRQARLFFIFVMLSIVGTQTQEILLEPYGALALNMSVAQTTRLTSLWGTGAILSMALGGGWLLKRFGYRPVLRAGLGINVSVFLGIIVAGLLGSVELFRGLVLVLGVGTGLAFAGAMAAVIDFTTVTRAGFLMGVWGAAAELGEALGNLFGGAIVDTLRALTGSALVAYGAVFLLEGALLVAALALLGRINVQESIALREEVTGAARAEGAPLPGEGQTAAVPDMI
ncbi:MAG: BCD family MFS transporter [Anaerolineae bacterium]